MGTLLLSMGLAAGFTGWQTAQARQLRAAQVLGLDNWVRAEAQALHHWLHQAQASWQTPATRGTARQLTRGTARQLTVAETLTLTTDYRAPWLKAPAGWDVTYLISNPFYQANPGERAHGILAIISTRFPDAAAGAADLRGVRRMQSQLTALCRSLTAEDEAPEDEEEAADQRARLNLGAQAEILAQTAGMTGFGAGRGCERDDIGNAVAVFAAPLAGIDTNLVLREARSGFPPPQMETALNMGGNDIIGVGTLEASGIAAASTDGTLTIELGPNGLTITDGLTVEGNLTAQGALVAAGGQISGSVGDVGQLTATEHLAVTGNLTAGDLSITGPPAQPGAPVLRAGVCTGC